MVAIRSDNFDWSIVNNKQFSNDLTKLGKLSSDFSIPFRLIASDFYRSQKKLFQLQSEGLYPPLGGFNYDDLAPGGKTREQEAQEQKERRTRHRWAPILFGETGDLKDSTLSKTHKNSVFSLGKMELIIGTNVKYGKYHQSDKSREKIPQRKFVFIDGGPTDLSKDASNAGRRERWIQIIQFRIGQLIARTYK